MRLPTFDRSDFRAVRLLVAAVGIAVPLFSVVVPLVRWVSGAALTGEVWGIGRPALAPGVRLADGVRLGGGETLDVRLERAGAATWLASLLPGLLLSVAVVAVVVLLLRLIASIQAGRPFVAASARSLRLGAWVALASAIVVPLGTTVADAALRSAALVDEAPGLTLSFSPATLVAGLLVLVLAEAFAQGVRMQDDVEGLV